VLDALGRRAEAQAHYRRSLELSPDDRQARLNLERSLAGVPATSGDAKGR
jgi:Flp pilus assembly protein TadD